ncbi:MAG TPA: TadE/TadG family type IV pilus assembly protein [Devosiaceae bacterium]
MFTRLRKFAGLVARLAREREGIAAVEFALVLPVMLILYIGSIEASQAITVDRKVTTLVGSLGDLVSRSEDTITQTQLTDYFKAAQLMLLPYNKTNLKQVVSCIQVASDGTAKVYWSYAYNGATAHTQNASFTLPPETASMAAGGYIIVAEAVYSYKSLFGLVITNDMNMYHEGFYLPRFGGKIDVTS